MQSPRAETVSNSTSEHTEPEINLIGVFYSPEIARVIVNTQELDGARSLAVGDELNGWTVLSINHRTLVIERAGTERTVRFEEDGAIRDLTPSFDPQTSLQDEHILHTPADEPM